MKKIVVCCFTAVVLENSLPLHAQDFGITYTTELQTDFRKKVIWINLLRTDFSLPLGKYFCFDGATISIAKSCHKRLVHDLQVFSNIEEENLPLALAVGGLHFQKGCFFCFWGIRNLNEDYFISPYTSLFTNSSCGIFPTLSANYPIANYPVASVGMDCRITIKKWKLEASVYNGTGYKDFTGKSNVFRFCPQSDGLLAVAAVDYQLDGNGYFGGVALHQGNLQDKDPEMHQGNGVRSSKIWNTVVWGYVEQYLSQRIHLLAQYSINPTDKMGCRNYAGGGLLCHCKQTIGGFFVNYADFQEQYEWAGELTWKIPCFEKGYVQPTLHFIKNSQEGKIVGLLRFGYDI